MLNLKFIEIDINPIKPKATVHATGRLGFNAEAIQFMNLPEKRNFKVAVSDEDGVALRNIYLIEDDNSKSVAKVSKSGDYYYLNVGNLFEELNIDYKNYTIIYDVKKGSYDNREMFILKMRKPKLKKKQEGEQDNSTNEGSDHL